NLISRDGARRPDRVPEFLFHGLVMKASLSVPFILGAFLYLTAVREKGAFELTVIYTALFGSLMLSMTGVIRSAFTAVERMEYVFYTNLPSRLISISILAVTLGLGWNLVFSAAAISLENVLWFGMLGAVSLRFFPIQFKFSFSTIRYMISESWSLALYSFFNIFYLSLDVMMIDYLMGVESVAPYTYASQLMEGLIMLASGYLIAVYPVFSRLHETDDGAYQRLFQQSVVVLLTLTIPATVLLGFWSSEWMSLIPGNQPISGAVLRVLSITLNLSILNTLLIIVFTSRNRQRLLVAFTGGAVGFSFASNWLLIPLFAQAGAAYATLISQSALFLVMGAVAWRLFGIRIPWVKPLGILSVSLFSGFALWIIPGLPLLAVPFLYPVVLYATARLSGVLTQEEIKKLIQTVRK
ncbi:MAG: oligosaccharide flippase family protein, partial [Candidatus Hinthialibacter sp.]